MAKVKVDLSQVELDEDTEQLELDPDSDAVDFTDNYTLTSKRRIENVDERVDNAYDNAVERILNGNLEARDENTYTEGVSDFDDFYNRFKDAHGLTDADKEPEEQWKETHVSPLKDELSQKEKKLENLQSELQQKRESELNTMIKEGARQAGVKDEVLQSNRFIRAYKPEFDYDDERKEWGWKDEEGFKAHPEDGNKYAKPQHFFERLKENGKEQHLFPKETNDNSGFEPSQTSEGGKVHVSEQQYKDAIGTEKFEEYKELQKEGRLEIGS